MWVALLLLAACGAPPAGAPRGRDDGGARDTGMDAVVAAADAGSDGAGTVADAGRSVDAGGEADAGPHVVRAGLRLLTQIEHPTAGPHLGELAVSGDARTVFVANSWDGFGVYAREPDGEIGMTLARPDHPEPARCTTLAVHEPSHTLYCSSDEAFAVRAYDLGDPEHPVLRDPNATRFSFQGVRDIHVVGETLYLAAFDRGLWACAIAADGALSAPVRTEVSGNVRFVAGRDGHLAALSADPALLVLDGSGSDVTVASVLRLEGTPQDLSVRGTRAAVALGSAGAAVIDLDGDPPAIVRSVQPRAVATGADLDGDLLAVTSLTGAYLYDLAPARPPLRGYVPSGDVEDHGRGVMLAGRFVGGELITSDWIFVERFAVDGGGDVTMLDRPRGLYLRPGDDAVIAFRNEGELPFELSLRAGATFVPGAIGPRTTAHVVVPAAVLEAVRVDPEGSRSIWITATPDGAPGYGGDLEVLLRPDAPLPPADFPAPGDPFPDIVVADPAHAIVPVPAPGVRTRVIFFTRDCAAMWPVLEDAAWLGGRGALDGGAVPFLLTQSAIAEDGYAARWALDGASSGHFHYLAPPEVWEHNGGMDLYELRFKIAALPRAAAHPTDYLVDDLGTVEAVEVFYRGAHPLR